MQMTAKSEARRRAFESDQGSGHAELAMQAARRVRRARRQSQKEKMGHAVCHHLLCLLRTDEAETAASPVTREVPGANIQRARRLPAEDERQISLGF